MRSVTELYLKKIQLHVKGDQGEDLIVPESHEKYKSLKKETDEAMKKTRRAAKNNETYKEVLKVLEAIRVESMEVRQEGDDGDMYDEDKKRERQRKKRKILKPLREYTNHNCDEGRFKGWSKRAAGNMTALCKKLREDKPECSRFRAAYREVYRARNQEKHKEGEVEEIAVDYDEQWDVGNVAQVEI